MYIEVIAGLLVLGICIILTMLVRSLTKIYENGFKAGGKSEIDASRMQGILTDSVNEALKLKEDRDRKRTKKQQLLDLSDEELARKLEEAKEENGN